ncbi:dihydrofolate reductase [Chryseobacterium sp. L7]|uniref:Dihydrofolate reductase n=1 Tax=Chryseobacterium endalhagicum TaxID=2797638 RepID=A0ABS1QA17_9FLAO|nr:dihydrofolate reductase family protein [Chryseobacterium endalhagicum]MBL1219454.1 dihydrofolate reductase [Chryseobacterium endalhagicum]
MRKIILDLAVTLDGFIEGPNGETDWCIMDGDMNFTGFLDSIDTILYGRVSYDAWGTYQPEDHAAPEETEFWKTIHSKNKYVFSGQPRKDPGAVFISSGIAGKISEIKEQPGKDIWLYGGAGLIKTFITLDLIDVYRISVHPVALGSGKPLFEDLKERLKLKLITTNVFRSGVVQLIYEPENK